MQTQPKRKVQKLIKQFPFVNTILAKPMIPKGPTGKRRNEFTDLTIKVQKADGDLMFRRADNTGLGDNSFSFAFEGPRKDQVSKRGEYFYAIDTDGNILNYVVWPFNIQSERGKPLKFAWSVFWTGRVSYGGPEMYSDPIHEKVKFVVWVTVTAYHKYTKDHDAPFGEFVDRTAHVTIYSAPACGFKKLAEDSNVYDNLYLDSHVLMRGALDKDFDLITIGGQLGELCRLFQDDVYHNGMKDVLDKSEITGASGKFGPVELLVGGMRGYTRFQLEDSVSRASFQVRPDSNTLYVLAVWGTLPRIRNLVKTMARIWNSNSAARASFKPNPKITPF